MTRRLELARQRLGTNGRPAGRRPRRTATIPDGAFDDVLAFLVLHYLEDWAAPLAELRRVLKPGGRPMLSLNHPLVFRLANPGADYSAPVE